MSYYEADSTPLSRANRGRFYTRYGKRIFDLMLSLPMFVLLAPVIAALVLLARKDGGPGLYAHTRIGRGGEAFKCWKIRTMVPDADQVLSDMLKDDPLAAVEWARAHKLDKDPRVTPLGRVLRRTSLDELPQIFNVLRGEMSLVGPRPITAGELAFYAEEPQSYLSQTPGITGLWQVEGRRDGCYRKRVALDRQYHSERGFVKDIGLILRTAGVVVSPTGR